jgi:hypothetical protein
MPSTWIVGMMSGPLSPSGSGVGVTAGVARATGLAEADSALTNSPAEPRGSEVPRGDPHADKIAQKIKQAASRFMADRSARSGSSRAQGLMELVPGQMASTSSMMLGSSTSSTTS